MIYECVIHSEQSEDNKRRETIETDCESDVVAILKDSEYVMQLRILDMPKESRSDLQKCSYCKETKKSDEVSNMLSNGYCICKSCMKKFGWTSIETMTEKKVKDRINYTKREEER